MARWSVEGIGWPRMDQGGVARGVWAKDRLGGGWGGLEWSGPRIDRGVGGGARVVWAKDRPGGGGVARGVWAMDGPGGMARGVWAKDRPGVCG